MAMLGTSSALHCSAQRWSYFTFHRHSYTASHQEKRKTSLKYSTTQPFTFLSPAHTHHFYSSPSKAHSAGHCSESSGDSLFSAPSLKYFSSIVSSSSLQFYTSSSAASSYSPGNHLSQPQRRTVSFFSLLAGLFIPSAPFFTSGEDLNITTQSGTYS